MGRLDQVLTESWKDKRYENDLTSLYFEVIRKISRTRTSPTLEMLREAYTAAMEFLQAVVYSKQHLKEFKKRVIPVMEDIELILYGQPGRREIVEKAFEYGVRLVNVKNRPEIEGGILLLRKIDDRVFLVKQWAYEEGLLLTKPIERKYGLEALEDVLEQ